MNEHHDLVECENEPIHIPSAIQPHGFFLAVSPENGRIIAASTNIDRFFTFSAEAMAGEKLSTFFPLLSQWALDHPRETSPLPEIFPLSHTREHSHFVIHTFDSGPWRILEGEPAMHDDLFPDSLPQSVINEAITLTAATSIEELCSLGTHSLRRLSGFGRVMAYRFDEEYNGCVIAETRLLEMDSYLDHHFPASDIPSQARELYRTHLIRYIGDAAYCPVPLLSTVRDPIDMSGSHLRSVSPIHLEYLHNMGVGASMSLSIIVEDQLWGLFACHHPVPLPLSATRRRYCEMFIRLFNALIQEKLNNDASEAFFRLKNRHSALMEASRSFIEYSDIHEVFSRLGPLWLEALESDGVCLHRHGATTLYAITPDLSSIAPLCDLLDPLHQDGLYSTPSLSESFPALSLGEPIAGILSLIISHQPPTRILWFRKEWVQELKWAGNPDKALIDASQRISPRQSFETLILQQRGRSRPWSPAQLSAARLYKEFGAIVQLDDMQRRMERQNRLILQQGKMAIMGEMIEAIAHQWNQPLNALSLLVSGLTEVIEIADSERKELEEIKQMGMAKITFMSETIEAFRNFFKPDRVPRPFLIRESILDVSRHLLPQLPQNGIALTIDGESGTVEGYENEFKQVILNLLVNASEALTSQNIKEPWIRCTIKQSDTTITLSICDNAGGINPDHLNQIFTPHFSTKGEEMGRGIGLYLSKMIIEEHFAGVITVYNTKEGVCFELIFPKSAL